MANRCGPERPESRQRMNHKPIRSWTGFFPSLEHARFIHLLNDKAGLMEAQ